MTLRNVLMPWLAQVMGNVYPVMPWLSKVMGWLAKVMA